MISNTLLFSLYFCTIFSYHAALWLSRTNLLSPFWCTVMNLKRQMPSIINMCDVSTFPIQSKSSTVHDKLTQIYLNSSYLFWTFSKDRYHRFWKSVRKSTQMTSTEEWVIKSNKPSYTIILNLGRVLLLYVHCSKKADSYSAVQERNTVTMASKVMIVYHTRISTKFNNHCPRITHIIRHSSPKLSWSWQHMVYVWVNQTLEVFAAKPMSSKKWFPYFTLEIATKGSADKLLTYIDYNEVLHQTSLCRESQTIFHSLLAGFYTTDTHYFRSQCKIIQIYIVAIGMDSHSYSNEIVLPIPVLVIIPHLVGKIWWYRGKWQFCHINVIL